MTRCVAGSVSKRLMPAVGKPLQMPPSHSPPRPSHYLPFQHDEATVLHVLKEPVEALAISKLLIDDGIGLNCRQQHPSRADAAMPIQRVPNELIQASHLVCRRLPKLANVRNGSKADIATYDHSLQDCFMRSALCAGPWSNPPGLFLIRQAIALRRSSASKDQSAWVGT